MTQSASILIVDDHHSNRRLLRCQLESQSFQVVEARDGVEALEMVLSYKPDLILLDVNMPHLSGFDVVRFLKDHPQLQSVPCIAVTAMASRSDRDLLLQAGFDGHLPKPYLIGDLLRIVHRALKDSLPHLYRPVRLPNPAPMMPAMC